MPKKLGLIIIVLSLIMILAGCSVSKEEAADEAAALFSEGFYAEPMDANESTDKIEFYLPNTLTVSDVSENNLIFEKDGQLFLLFYNPAEGLDSKVNMERDAEFKEKATVFETIEENDRFGYMMIVSEEGDVKKLVIGVGGIKMTTLSPVAQLTESAEIMLEIINSITYQ